MTDKSKRMTIVVSPEIEVELKAIKKDLFYDCNLSYMIRELIWAGFRSLETKNYQVNQEENADMTNGYIDL